MVKHELATTHTAEQISARGGFRKCLTGESAPLRPIYVRPDQAIHILNVSRRSLSNFQQRGILRFYRVGRLILYKVSDLENALEKFAVPAVGEVPTPDTINVAVLNRKRRMQRITPA